MRVGRADGMYGCFSSLKSYILRTLGLVRVESCPRRADLPWVGRVADEAIRDRY